MDKRPNLVLALVAVLVVALAVIAGVLSANREHPALDASTPEGAAQLFVLAVLEGDAAAVDHLDPGLGCRAPIDNSHGPEGVSMTVAGTTVNGDRATVQIDVTQPSGGLFGTYDHREVFRLHRDGSRWLLSEVPWPVYSCE